MCVVPKGAGGVCQNDGACAPGTHCDYGLGACAADYPTGQSCKDGNECGPGGTCSPASNGAFACAPTPGAGQSCLFDCQEGLTCATDPVGAACVPEICLTL